MVSFDPTRPDFTPYGFTCVRWAPSPMRRPDHHNEIELNFLESGWVTYLLGGQKLRLEAGSLQVFWGAIPHQIIDYGPQEDYWVATIPLAWFLQCRMPDKLVQPLLRGEVMREEGPAADGRRGSDPTMFSQWERDLRDSRDESVSIVMLEMEARLLRLAAGLPKATKEVSGRKPGPLSRDGRLNKVERMACLVAQRYTEPLTVETIAKEVDLHPNYSMSLFKRAFGTTLIDYLTHHRVSHAQRLLATTEMKVVEVAFESGFNSLSRFNEAFRRACNQSPRNYRREHQISE